MDRFSTLQYCLSHLWHFSSFSTLWKTSNTTSNSLSDCQTSGLFMFILQVCINLCLKIWSVRNVSSLIIRDIIYFFIVSTIMSVHSQIIVFFVVITVLKTIQARPRKVAVDSFSFENTLLSIVNVEIEVI